ncbi:MAG: HPr family phosphocarrier protein [Clostridia bacterium]|nr:HPr family phosphocarrier protein [Clostridia bacterium]
MKQFSYVLTSDHAMHGKPAAGLAKEAARFSSRIRLLGDMKAAELTDVHDVLMLDMRCGDSVTVWVDGSDEEDAVAALQNYFVANM